MKKFRLTEIGTLTKGERFRKEDMSPGSIPYVGAIENNNGITYYCEHNEGMPIHPAGTITIPYNGSIGFAFLQDKAYYAGDDVNILNPNTECPLAKLYIATTIRKEAYRFNYGRKWNMDRMKLSTILLPSKNGQPDWEAMAETVGKNIPDYFHLRKPAIEAEVELKDYKLFDIKTLFAFQKGTGPSSEEAVANTGETPFINAQKHSNGILCYTNHPATHPSNSITWVAQGAGASGKAFAQSKPFCSTATVNVLVPKWDSRIEELIYIARVITEAEWKFSFGRAVNGNRKHIKISLPTKKGEPDWEGITKFIRSCKFSSSI